MDNSVNVTSRYFDRRDIPIAEDEIVVVSCMRNELQRLPYFLEYYRTLGVTRFLLVDNNSTDGTEEYLRSQADVEYFRTSSSYRGSSAGRLWMQELADTYAVDHWVVTADVDELLVFPGIESLDLPDLCAYLDDNGYAGLFTVMLDMYSDRPLAETVYTPGTDFLETCSFFETDTYRFRPSSVPPFLSINGGPRGRLFDATDKGGYGPAMKKVPLVKWEQGFSYIFSTHSHRFVPLADITGLLLHFKFFASFGDVAATEALRGDRRQPADYSIYQKSVDGQLCFFGDQSRRYEGASELVRLGSMCATPRYAGFVARRLGLTEPDSVELEPEAVERLAALLPQPEPATGITLRALPTVWPLVNNQGIATFFGNAEPRARDHRVQFVMSMRNHVRVLDVRSDHLLFRLDETALHRWERSGLAVAVYVGDRLLRNALIDGSDGSFEVEVDSLEAGVFRLKADVGRAAEGLLVDREVTVSVYLLDGLDEVRMNAPVDHPDAGVRPQDVLIHCRPWHRDGVNAADSRRFSGVLERLLDGNLRGWAYDALEDRFDRPVNVYINGRLARQIKPITRRRSLEPLRGRPGAPSGRGFSEALPLKFFEESGDETVTIEAFVAGTNVALRRSPLVLPAGTTSARWDDERGAWTTGGPELFVDEDRAPAGSAEPAAVRLLRRVGQARAGRREAAPRD